MQNRGISQAVIRRLPRYYRYLGELIEQGVERISSNELSKRMKVTASQIRQDLNNFGGFGQQGYGYNVKYLYSEIGKILGLEQDHNIIIIGAGPVGIYAATLANLHGLKGIVLESLSTAGGQLKELYPQKDILDVPGFSRIAAKEYIEALLKQQESDSNHLQIVYGEQVKNIEKQEDKSIKVTTNKNTYLTKTILLTTGMGVFTPRKTGLEGEDDLTNIYYSVKDKSIFKDQEIVILGGGDSAVDWAIALSDIAKKVNIVHRRDEFRAQESSVNLMTSKGVNIYKPYGLVSFVKDGNKAKGIVIKHNVDGSEITLNFDSIIVNYGTVTSASNFAIEETNRAYNVDRTFRTSFENVFAVGNSCYYEGKVKNITCGLGEAVIAITEIDRIVHPGKNIPVHF